MIEWNQQNKSCTKASITNGCRAIDGLPRVTSMSWEINPNKILVDMGQRRTRQLPQSDKRAIGEELGLINRTYWESIPLKEIFDTLERHGVVPLQEDGTKWSGFLSGAKECGSGSENQRALFRLALRNQEGAWELSSSTLSLTWCTINRSSEANGYKPKFEIVSYVS